MIIRKCNFDVIFSLRHSKKTQRKKVAFGLNIKEKFIFGINDKRKVVFGLKGILMDAAKN